MDDGNYKSSFAPPQRYSEWCHETGKQIGGRQFQRWAWSIFGLKKNSNNFFVRQGFPPFSESLISIWTVLFMVHTDDANNANDDTNNTNGF